MEKHNLTPSQMNRIALWTRRVADCKRSELTVSTWCIQNGINEKSYWRWHKVLKDMYADQLEEQLSQSHEFFEIPDQPKTVSSEILATIHIGICSAADYTYVHHYYCNMQRNFIIWLL